MEQWEFDFKKLLTLGVENQRLASAFVNCMDSVNTHNNLRG